jgi:hypothetical protein
MGRPNLRLEALEQRLALNAAPVATDDQYQVSAGQTLHVGLPDGGERVTLVAAGSTWRYLDNGSDQGTAWRQSAFNDSAWSSGLAELGYVDGE